MTEAEYDPEHHYDRITSAWRLLLGDDLHYGVFDRGDESLPVATNALTSHMADAAQLSPGLEVLDVGCGSGGPACHLVESFGVTVVGITTSQVGVAEATERAASRGLSAATFEQRDGMDNGFPDESFDRVWVLESSHLMRDRERLLAECARVLRPGGRLALCDIIRRREIPFAEVRDRRADFVTLRSAFGDARMEPLAYYTDIADKYGLQVDHAEDLTGVTLPTFACWRANAETHREEVVAAIGAAGLDAFERGTEILEAFWQDGTFGYGLFSAAKPST
jgi:27-O-demethylrifamycin SV methyltransferase